MAISPLTALVHGLVTTLGQGASDWWRSKLAEKAMNRQTALTGLLAGMQALPPEQQEQLATQAKQKLGVDLFAIPISETGQKKFLLPPLSKEQVISAALGSLPPETQSQVAIGNLAPELIRLPILQQQLGLEEAKMRQTGEIATQNYEVAKQNADAHMIQAQALARHYPELEHLQEKHYEIQQQLGLGNILQKSQEERSKMALELLKLSKEFYDLRRGGAKAKVTDTKELERLDSMSAALAQQAQALLGIGASQEKQGQPQQPSGAKQPQKALGPAAIKKLKDSAAAGDKEAAEILKRLGIQ